MRRRIWIFCTIAGVLAAIAFVPGILVTAAFLGGLPAIILILAPYALLIGLAILLVGTLSPGRQSLNKAAVIWTLSGCVLALAVAAAWFNQGLKQEVQAITREDRDSTEPLTGTRDIAIQFVTIERARLKVNLHSSVKMQIRTSFRLPPENSSASACAYTFFSAAGWTVCLCRRFRCMKAIPRRPILERSERVFTWRAQLAGIRRSTQTTRLHLPIGCLTVGRSRDLSSRCRHEWSRASA